MNPGEAVQFAQELVEAYGLSGWRVELDNAVRRFGCCHHVRKVITLSYDLVELNDEASVLEVILHEIAHALAGPRSGHGPEWQRIARSIGSSAKRCYSSERTIRPPARYLLRCAHCGRFANGRFEARFVLQCEPIDR
jgi:predicted SprT family Zn-dependent metalloprotease